MQKIKILTMVAITILTSVYGYSGSGSDAFASHGSNAIACEADGYEAGLDDSFSQKLYETCEEVGGADAYYDGFIEGCMSVEGNTRDVCELATDAD